MWDSQVHMASRFIWEPAASCCSPRPFPHLTQAALHVQQRPLVVATVVHRARAAHAEALRATEELERPPVARAATALARAGLRTPDGGGQHLQQAAQLHVAAQLGALGERLATFGAYLFAAAPRILDTVPAEAVPAGQRHRVAVPTQADGTSHQVLLQRLSGHGGSEVLRVQTS